MLVEDTGKGGVLAKVTGVLRVCRDRLGNAVDRQRQRLAPALGVVGVQVGFGDEALKAVIGVGHRSVIEMVRDRLVVGETATSSRLVANRTPHALRHPVVKNPPVRCLAPLAERLAYG